MLISIVFSFRNEEKNLKELIERVTNSLSELKDVNYELIFVNDDSNDGSLYILKEMMQHLPIKNINMSRRFGSGPCVIAGFEHAKGDAVIYLDSDLQDPPELFPKLIQKFKEGKDVVHTKRLSRAGENPIKMWFTLAAYRIINLFSDINLPINSGDFKLISRRALGAVLNSQEYDPYIRGMSVWAGFDQDFVEYNRESRFAGKTHFSIWSKGPINEFIRGITSYSAAPLYISILIGFFSVIISILLSIYSLYTKFVGISAFGVSGLIIIVCFFSGIILISNGFIGIYVAKIFYQVKGRPKYIIKDIIE